jgi:hypothetical protein
MMGGSIDASIVAFFRATVRDAREAEHKIPFQVSGHMKKNDDHQKAHPAILVFAHDHSASSTRNSFFLGIRVDRSNDTVPIEPGPGLWISLKGGRFDKSGSLLGVTLGHLRPKANRP